MSDDCCPNTGVLSVDAALSQLQRAACTVLPKVEDILLTQALGQNIGSRCGVEFGCATPS
jgi:hypothetical protein